MKKYTIWAFAAAISFAAVLSCAKEESINNFEDPENNLAGEQVTINASISPALTKVVFDPTYTADKPSSLSLTWKSSDKLRVADHANSSSYVDFDLTSGAGGQSAVFTGTAPVGATSYDVSIVNGEVAANQEADGTTTHLQYLASKTGVTDLTNISFDTFNSILAITAKMPPMDVAAKIKSVDITASANIFNGGNTLNITLTNIGDAGGDGVLHFYATLPQGDQAIEAGTSLLVKFNAPGETQDVYTRYIELPATSFTSSKLNTININAVNSASYANASSTDIGKSTNPYLVGDKYQLAAISGELSTTEKEYFKLVDNIAVSAWTSINCNTKGAIDLEGNNKSISGLNMPLFEYFDGRVSNLTLSNAEIAVSGGSYYGVLARTVDGDKSCELYNVSVVNSSLSCKGTLGGIIGKIASSTPCSLTNCSADVDVTGTFYYLGGLVGQVTNGTLTHCSATGDVSTSSVYVSGLVGFVDGTVRIEKCYATGDIKPTVNNAVANTGGIVGYINASADLTILNCYYAGTIGTNTYKHRRWCGGILGTTAVGAIISVTNCYASFSVNTDNANVDGALVGKNESTALTCSGYVGWTSITKMAGASTSVSADGNYLGTSGTIYSQAVTLGGWNFTNVWTTDDIPQLRPYTPAP